ncbi:MAG: hypothetical protein U9Q92_06085 [archaeon]|nr:hypothetical protein [archaeon]
MKNHGIPVRLEDSKLFHCRFIYNEKSWNTCEVGGFQAFSSPFFSDEKKGFRELIVKSVAFVVLLALMQVLTSPLAGMARVPRELKPFSFLQVGEAMLFSLLFSVFLPSL